MSRRRRRSRVGVDLFPFLSIIVCVIGILTLLISALAVAGSVGKERADRVDRRADLEGELKRLAREAAELQRLTAEARELAGRRDRLVSEVEARRKLRPLEE